MSAPVRYTCGDLGTNPGRFAGYTLDGSWFLDGSFYLEAWPAVDSALLLNGRFACSDASVVPTRYVCV